MRSLSPPPALSHSFCLRPARSAWPVGLLPDWRRVPSGSSHQGRTRCGSAGRTALDNYVAAPDSDYSFSLLNKIPAADYTTYVLEMTVAGLADHQRSRSAAVETLDDNRRTQNRHLLQACSSSAAVPMAVPLPRAPMATSSRSPSPLNPSSPNSRWFPTSHWFSPAKPKVARRIP